MALERAESEPASPSEVAFQAVHSIALRGIVRELDPGSEELLDAGLVRPVAGGFQLTELGYSNHRALLEHERTKLDLARLGMAYAPFPALARILAQLRASWHKPAGVLTRRRQASQLCGLVDDTAPVLRRVVVVARRFSVYLPRLNRAAAHVRGGDHEYAFAEQVDSIGAVWQELHEDLLQTLGRAHELEDV
jgi:hypothetical protein